MGIEKNAEAHGFVQSLTIDYYCELMGSNKNLSRMHLRALKEKCTHTKSDTVL